MSAAKVELGRLLFYDTRLSVIGGQSCAFCHVQALAFTDARARAEGTTGERHPRSAMSLVNITFTPSLTWDDPALYSLEAQAFIPISGTDPIELGMAGEEARFLRELREDDVYRTLFPAAFVEASDLYSMANVARALATFQRTLISVRSHYHRYRYGGSRRRSGRPPSEGNGSSPPESAPDAFSATEVELRRTGGRAGRRALRAIVREHRALQYSEFALAPGTEYRAAPAHRPGGGRWTLQGTDSSEHRGDRPLHARPERGHAGGGDRALRSRGSDDRRQSLRRG